jgi:hypothetical protein
MSKVATIASLNRAASRSEDDFVATTQAVLDEADHQRTADFFDKLNIPRSVSGERMYDTLPDFVVGPDKIGNYLDERTIADGIQKFMDRHERKLKWHASHPDADGIENVILMFRAGAALTVHRLERLQLLLRSKDEITAQEWAIARELTNRAYLSYRNYLNLLAGEWVDGMVAIMGRDDVSAKIGRFYEVVDGVVRSLEEHRKRIEERRMLLTTLPLDDRYPPVKPPNYFGGDLMGVGPWSQFWNSVINRAHHFRETVG